MPDWLIWFDPLFLSVLLPKVVTRAGCFILIFLEIQIQTVALWWPVSGPFSSGDRLGACADVASICTSKDMNMKHLPSGYLVTTLCNTWNHSFKYSNGLQLWWYLHITISSSLCKSNANMSSCLWRIFSFFGDKSNGCVNMNQEIAFHHLSSTYGTLHGKKEKKTIREYITYYFLPFYYIQNLLPEMASLCLKSHLLSVSCSELTVNEQDY